MESSSWLHGLISTVDKHDQFNLLRGKLKGSGSTDVDRSLP